MEAYHEAMRRLLGKHGVQASVINDAIKNGTGYLDRDAVYELGNYPQTRSLKGFTRPVNRIQQGLVDDGLLPADADDLLVTDYDLTVKGYQRARGFQVPLEVVRLLHDLNRGQADGAR